MQRTIHQDGILQSALLTAKSVWEQDAATMRANMQPRVAEQFDKEAREANELYMAIINGQFV